MWISDTVSLKFLSVVCKVSLQINTLFLNTMNINDFKEINFKMTFDEAMANS